MVIGKGNTKSKKTHRKILDDSELKQAEQEKIDSEPSLYKQNYGWITLGGALVILAIVLLILLLRNKDSLAVMVTFSVLSFIVGLVLIIVPLCLTRFRVSSIPLIEAMGKDEFEDFSFLTTDNTFDQTLKKSFGQVFYEKLTEKKELEVLKGIDKGRKFVTYDFKALNENVSSAPRNIEGTLIRVYIQGKADGSTYASSNTYAEMFLPLEKLPIGDDGLIYFGKSKEDIQKNIDVSKIKSIGLPFVIEIDSNSISVILFGRTIDVRRIERGQLTQEKYEGLADNLYPLKEVLDSIC